MTNLFVLLVQALWFIAPAYAANSFPPIMKGTRPIDGNKTFRGKRMLGDGKTVEGTLGGFFFALGIGLIQIAVQQNLAPLNFSLMEMTPVLIMLLAAGALIGDMVASFFKRQIGFKRGDPVLLLDQLDFVVMAFLFASLVTTIPLAMLVIILVITPPLHLITNVFGYLVKLKRNPW
ncbi:MAG: CDP-2,3-bis-(O-geranylgeranyl)-sn-glycerol synthase [Candidatus Aenigmarchaeota archaeon]|nr:CDP-2,3-bis-(O-geranylgeranyl)-sn-glycerol synthase [Candidatus Aenigmarchaeota archaeon]